MIDLPVPTVLAILPSAWFSDLHQLVLLLITAIAMVLVIKGADWLVEGAAGIASRLGMPKVVIGATIVSLGTTSPEAAVSVLAAWSGNAGLALGNGVGSIIADTGLIFGVGCMLVALPADRFILSRQGWVQFGSGVAIAAICYGLYAIMGDQAAIGRVIGLLLVAALGLYMLMSIRWSRQHVVQRTHHVKHPTNTAEDEVHIAQRSLLALMGMGLIGLLVVVVAGDGLVKSVSVLAEAWGVPQAVIASTIVALGTSLPELVVGITAIRKGHAALLVGNVIGADILNVLFVVGAAALASPLPVVDAGASRPLIFLELQLPTMLIMLVLFRLFIARASKTGQFSRWMGIPLVALYLTFLVTGYALTAGK